MQTRLEYLEEQLKNLAEKKADCKTVGGPDGYAELLMECHRLLEE